MQQRKRQKKKYLNKKISIKEVTIINQAFYDSSSKKFERMAGVAMDVCLRVPKESNKSRATARVSRTVY